MAGDAAMPPTADSTIGRQSPSTRRRSPSSIPPSFTTSHTPHTATSRRREPPRKRPREILAALKTDYLAGNLIVVAGEQLARSAGLPGRAELVRLLVGEAQRQGRLDDMGGAEIEANIRYGKVAEAMSAIRACLGPVAFVREVQRHLAMPTGPSPIADAIVSLAPSLRAVINIGLDLTLYQAFAGHWGRLLDRIPGDIARRRDYILTLSGLRDAPQTWMLTREAYERAAAERWLRVERLAMLMQCSPLLYIGYDFNHPELEAALARLRNYALRSSPGDALPQHYAVVERGAVAAERKTRLKEAGVHFLEFPPMDNAAEPAIQVLSRLAKIQPRARSASAEITMRLRADECPYPGLRPFCDRDGHLFFGRAAEVTAALDRLGGTRKNRWLHLEGPCGAGKTSLVRSGLVPRIRVGDIEGAPLNWHVATMRPGRQPVISLAHAMQTALDAEDVPDFRTDDNALSDWLAAHITRTSAGHGVLLVVDSLEEVLLTADPSEREHFAALLANAVAQPRGPLYLVTVLRSECGGVVDALPPLADLLTPECCYHLRPLYGRGLREAVSEPALRAGAVWAEGLVERIVADAESIAQQGGRGGANGIAIPLVAHALRLLWQTRGSGDVLTHTAYEQHGGVAGALAASAEQTWNQLSSDVSPHAAADRKAAVAMVLALVEDRPEGPVLRWRTRTEILAIGGGGPQAARVLAHLSGERDNTDNSSISDDETNTGADQYSNALMPIVSIVGSGMYARVELVHEALLNTWVTLRSWLEEDRSRRWTERQLRERTTLWEESHRRATYLPTRSEYLEWRRATNIGECERAYLAAAERKFRRRRWLRRIGWAALVSTVVAAIAISLWALREKGSADVERAIAFNQWEQTNTLVGYVMQAVDKDLAEIPGAAQVRVRLLEIASALQETVRARDGRDLDRLRRIVNEQQSKGDEALERHDLVAARRAYEVIVLYSYTIAAWQGNTPDAMGMLSRSLLQLGDLARAQSAFEEARVWYEQGLSVAERMATHIVDPVAAQMNLLEAHGRLLLVSQALQDREAFRMHSQKGRHILSQLQKTNEFADTPRLKRWAQIFAQIETSGTPSPDRTDDPEAPDAPDAPDVTGAPHDSLPGSLEDI